MPVDVTGIAESLALVTASVDEPNAPTSQPSGNEDAEMHDGTNIGNQQGQDVTNSESTPVPVGSVPENNAMQGVDSLNVIVEVVNLARQLADRIGSNAEGSGAQDPVESGQPPSNSESGAPQPEDASNQAPVASESTNAAPIAAPSQRVTIMINGADGRISRLAIS